MGKHNVDVLAPFDGWFERDNSRRRWQRCRSKKQELLRLINKTVELVVMLGVVG